MSILYRTVTRDEMKEMEWYFCSNCNGAGCAKCNGLGMYTLPSISKHFQETEYIDHKRVPQNIVEAVIELNYATREVSAILDHPEIKQIAKNQVEGKITINQARKKLLNWLDQNSNYDGSIVINSYFEWVKIFTQELKGGGNNE